MEQPDVHDNPAQQRFELEVDGLTAFADYRSRPGVIVITHVEAPLLLRGTGAAGRLMQGVAEQARAKGLKIEPRCPYAQVWLERHPEQHDLIA